VYRDANGNGVRSADEPGLAGVKVYVDSNGNDRLDSGERTGVTDSAGRYTFSQLASGHYTVRFVAPSNHERTVPSSGKHIVQLGAGRNVTGKDFGALPLGTISGRVFNDLDADGVKDTNEAGAPDFRVFVDGNNNGKLDAAERSVLTGDSGTYSLAGLRPGTHVVRFVSQTGWRLTSPHAFFSVLLEAGQTRSGNNFGVSQAP
jgi:uncharacterized protein (DUF2141 family)